MANSDEDNFVSAPTSPPLNVARVGVKVPPFWKTNPRLWFSQIESQFFNTGITQDATKYHTLVASIESNILNAVSHIIENPPSENMYGVLKMALLTEFQDSEEKRLQKLLENVEIGDRKPSAMLREMRQLSSGKVSDDMLKSLWFQRLPPMIKAVLSISTDSLDKLAVMADKINDQFDNPSVSQVSKSNTSLRLDHIEGQVSEILKRIDQLSTSKNKHRRERSRNRSGSRSRDNSEAGSKCWYHYKFGKNATKCRQPCSYKSENE